LIGNIPRYFLAYGHGQAAVGIFAALYYLTLPGGIVVAAYCDSACPQLAKWGSDSDFRPFCKVLVLLVTAAAILGLGGWVIAYSAGRPILLLCYGPQYALEAPSLAWLMAGAGFLYISTVLGYAVTSLREFHLQVPFRAVHLFVVYLVCLYLIPKEGLLGAAKSIFVSSVMFAVAMAALFLVILRKKILLSREAFPTPEPYPAEIVLTKADS
jgi:O-antigen/teichoic acid export membrane protein